METLLAPILDGIDEEVGVNVEICQRAVRFVEASRIQSTCSRKNPGVLQFEDVEEIRARVNNRVVGIIRVDNVVLSLEYNRDNLPLNQDSTPKKINLLDHLSRLLFRKFFEEK